MQYDQTTTFAAKLKTMFEAPGMAEPLRAAIAALPAGERAKAEEAYRRLLAFDGRLAASSADAALYGAFLHESARHTFLDELGPDDSQTWKALLQVSGLSYSAQADHLLGRDDSPFWDDIGTPQVEDKPAILARSLAAAVNLLEAQVGHERSAWQWGKLHRYEWLTGNTQRRRTCRRGRGARSRRCTAIWIADPTRRVATTAR
ncbi:Acyl-homoserine lactone acylase QuiP OS=Stutzerimonas stutzeri OX=316 GN=CXK95_10735 PE=3 SV=1 [Stutzerimonas stutzeri]